MIRHRLMIAGLFCGLLAALGVPALGQGFIDGLPAVIVAQATFQRDGDDLTLTISGTYTPDTCDSPLIAASQLQDGHLYIDIALEPGIDNCLPAVAPADFTLTVGVIVAEGALSDDETLIVVVENFAGVLSLPASDPTAAEFTPRFKALHLIESVALTSLDSDPALRVAGFVPDGCAFEPTVRLSAPTGSDRLGVEIFRLLPTDIACPMIVVPYEDTIPLPRSLVALEDVAVIDVNGFRLEGADFAPQGDTGNQAVIVTPVTVERVAVLVTPTAEGVRLSLAVSVVYPDGCDFRIRTDVTRLGRNILVNIERMVVEGVMCPEVITTEERTIPLGEFEPGGYFLNVNGVTAELEF